MHSVSLSNAVYARLQKLAIPFVDTPETVIARLLDQAEKTGLTERIGKNALKVATSTYSSESLPPLVHTKLLAANFDGEVLEKTTWDGFVRLALLAVLRKVNNVQELKRISAANLVQGKKEDEGYKFVSSHNFSYQGVSAEDAVAIIRRCAKGTNSRASFEFEWRDKEGAHLPGQRATVQI